MKRTREGSGFRGSPGASLPGDAGSSHPARGHLVTTHPIVPSTTDSPRDPALRTFLTKTKTLAKESSKKLASGEETPGQRLPPGSRIPAVGPNLETCPPAPATQKMGMI